MKYSFLILIPFLFLACNPVDRSIDKPTPNQSYSLKTAGLHFSRFNDESIIWFFQLVEEGVEIPHAMIEKHTLISHSYGVFQGEAVKEVSANIKTLILRHTDKDCVKHFLLTSDGRKIIDQQLIAEACQMKEGETNHTYSEYVYLEPNFMGRLTYEVSGQEDAEVRLIDKTGFRISDEGKIEKISRKGISL